MTTLEFLTWLHDRLISVYTESRYMDFVTRLRAIVDGAREIRWCRHHDDIFSADTMNGCRTAMTRRVETQLRQDRCVAETKYLIGG